MDEESKSYITYHAVSETITAPDSTPAEWSLDLDEVMFNAMWQEIVPAGDRIATISTVPDVEHEQDWPRHASDVHRGLL